MVLVVAVTVVENCFTLIVEVGVLIAIIIIINKLQ